MARAVIAMARAGAKATLLALSVVATLGGWVALAGRERAAAPPSSGPVSATAVAGRPDIAQLPAALAAPTAAPAAPTMMPGAASSPNNSLRPLARTRSSR
jgi:hypothetical protein